MSTQYSPNGNNASSTASVDNLILCTCNQDSGKTCGRCQLALVNGQNAVSNSWNSFQSLPPNRESEVRPVPASDADQNSDNSLSLLTRSWDTDRRITMRSQKVNSISMACSKFEQLAKRNNQANFPQQLPNTEKKVELFSNKGGDANSFRFRKTTPSLNGTLHSSYPVDTSKLEPTNTEILVDSTKMGHDDFSDTANEENPKVAAPRNVRNLKSLFESKGSNESSLASRVLVPTTQPLIQPLTALYVSAVTKWNMMDKSRDRTQTDNSKVTEGQSLMTDSKVNESITNTSSEGQTVKDIRSFWLGKLEKENKPIKESDCKKYKKHNGEGNSCVKIPREELTRVPPLELSDRKPKATCYATEETLRYQHDFEVKEVTRNKRCDCKLKLERRKGPQGKIEGVFQPLNHLQVSETQETCQAEKPKKFDCCFETHKLTATLSHVIEDIEIRRASWHDNRNRFFRAVQVAWWPTIRHYSIDFFQAKDFEYSQFVDMACLQLERKQLTDLENYPEQTVTFLNFDLDTFDLCISNDLRSGSESIPLDQGDFSPSYGKLEKLKVARSSDIWDHLEHFWVPSNVAFYGEYCNWQWPKSVNFKVDFMVCCTVNHTVLQFKRYHASSNVLEPLDLVAPLENSSDQDSWNIAHIKETESSSIESAVKSCCHFCIDQLSDFSSTNFETEDTFMDDRHDEEAFKDCQPSHFRQSSSENTVLVLETSEFFAYSYREEKGVYLSNDHSICGTCENSTVFIIDLQQETCYIKSIYWRFSTEMDIAVIQFWLPLSPFTRVSCQLPTDVEFQLLVYCEEQMSSMVSMLLDLQEGRKLADESEMNEDFDPSSQRWATNSAQLAFDLNTASYHRRECSLKPTSGEMFELVVLSDNVEIHNRLFFILKVSIMQDPKAEIVRNFKIKPKEQVTVTKTDPFCCCNLVPGTSKKCSQRSKKHSLCLGEMKIPLTGNSVVIFQNST